MNYTIRRAALGILFLAVGFGYLGKALGFWDFTIFFPGWWTMFLIIPSIYSMLGYGIHIGNSFVALLGTYFLLSANDIISISLTWPIVLAIVCICIGLKLIFGKKVTYYDFKFF